MFKIIQIKIDVKNLSFLDNSCVVEKVWKTTQTVMQDAVNRKKCIFFLFLLHMICVSYFRIDQLRTKNCDFWHSFVGHMCWIHKCLRANETILGYSGICVQALMHRPKANTHVCILHTAHFFYTLLVNAKTIHINHDL